jgi:hypothetical protein
MSVERELAVVVLAAMSLPCIPLAPHIPLNVRIGQLSWLTGSCVP